MEQIVFWHWWSMAAVFVVLEFMAPGVLFLWLAFGAIVSGLLLLLSPGTIWEMQFITFAGFSIISGIIGRFYYRKHGPTTDQPTLNRRGEQYIGRIVTIETAIVNGVGRAKLDDSQWKVQGPDMAAGTKAKVVNISSTVLYVEPVED